MGWGGFISNDVDIMRDLGLSYATFLIQVDEAGDIIGAEKLEDFTFVEDMSAFHSFSRFLDVHREFVEELSERMNHYIKGAWFVNSPEDPYSSEE